MATVYIETTIPSYYHETRTSPKIKLWRAQTREWWALHSHRYQLVTSNAVCAELREAPHPKAGQMLSLLADVALVEEPSAIENIAAYYVKNRVLSGEMGGDAYHLAIASHHGIDFLLTWNCRHLANANKMKHISVLNSRLGLKTPVIVTPAMLITETGQ